jgi:hypothetical protein
MGIVQDISSGARSAVSFLGLRAVVINVPCANCDVMTYSPRNSLETSEVRSSSVGIPGIAVLASRALADTHR